MLDTTVYVWQNRFRVWLQKELESVFRLLSYASKLVRYKGDSHETLNFLGDILESYAIKAAR